MSSDNSKQKLTDSLIVSSSSLCNSSEPSVSLHNTFHIPSVPTPFLFQQCFQAANHLNDIFCSLRPGLLSSLFVSSNNFDSCNPHKFPVESLLYDNPILHSNSCSNNPQYYHLLSPEFPSTLLLRLPVNPKLSKCLLQFFNVCALLFITCYHFIRSKQELYSFITLGASPLDRRDFSSQFSERSPSGT